MKFLVNVGASIALLLFLALIGDDCLRWYALPLSSHLHRSLFAGMIVLSFLSCLQLLGRLLAIRGLWEKTILKLASASVETETRLEAGVRYAVSCVASALCFYTSAVVWGVIYFSKGPIIKAGYVAIFVFIAYDVIAVIAGVKFERIKRSIKSRRAKAKTGKPTT